MIRIDSDTDIGMNRNSLDFSSNELQNVFRIRSE